MKTVVIESIDDPRVDIYRSLKKTNHTRRQELFVVEGATLVKRLFNSDFEVHSVLVTDARLAEFLPLIPPDAEVYVISRARACDLVGFKFHLGVLAAVYRQPTPNLSDVLPKSGGSLVLFGDRIIDQQNVGMMIRIGSAFGADAVVFSSGSADAFSRRVMRVSMGNGLFMPVLQTENAIPTLQDFVDLDYRLFATVLDEDAEPLTPGCFSERTVLVFGNESDGLGPESISQTDQQLTIPMLKGTDSVNVSIATGIFSYAYRTQFPQT